ncbi:hypothetical protein CRM22_007841 [Opisthorchis felineus]|uniref:Uncharacterized protein n=1 Tax=Opisthorchis felineus TaxID=147828 RepID=A0A4S2LDY1_OPIFE|nr:hypothetical protein CRM22_007841 [Opisthorchis felineus]
MIYGGGARGLRGVWPVNSLNKSAFPVYGRPNLVVISDEKTETCCRTVRASEKNLCAAEADNITYLEEKPAEIKPARLELMRSKRHALWSIPVMREIATALKLISSSSIRAALKISEMIRPPVDRKIPSRIAVCLSSVESIRAMATVLVLCCKILTISAAGRECNKVSHVCSI